MHAVIIALVDNPHNPYYRDNNGPTGLQGCSAPDRVPDANDPPFLDLALNGEAELLISGDRDLVALAGRTRFLIETPEAYRVRILQGDAGPPHLNPAINSAASCN